MTAKKTESIKSFEEGLSKLETIVAEMEDGQLPLEKLITHYEAGTKLLKLCDAKLKEAEKKIEILKSRNGEPADFAPLETD